MNKVSVIPLSVASLEKKGRDGFYVKEENGLYWLGVKQGQADLNYCHTISKEFYDDFQKESERQKIKMEAIWKRSLT